MNVAIERMLPDINPRGRFPSNEIPAAFTHLNGTPLSRGEAVQLIASCYLRRSLAPDVIKEGLQCLVRTNFPIAERARCCEVRSTTVLEEAITILHIMCYMSQETSIQCVYTALQDAGIPEDLIQSSQSVSLSCHVNHSLWQKWLMGGNKESLDLLLGATTSSSHPCLEDIVIDDKSAVKEQKAEVPLVMNGSKEFIGDISYQRLHSMPFPCSCSAINNNNSIDCCQEIINRLGPSATVEVREAFRCAQGDIEMALIQLRVPSQVAMVVACSSVGHLGCNSSFHTTLLRAYAQATGLLSSIGEEE